MSTITEDGESLALAAPASAHTTTRPGIAATPPGPALTPVSSSPRAAAPDPPSAPAAKPRTLGYILQGALGMSVLGASTAVSARLTAYPVLGGQALRYALAAAVFALIVRRRDRPRIRPSAREWLLLVLLSATGLILFNIFVLATLRHTDAATLGSVVACSPLVLAIAGPLVAKTGHRLRSRTVFTAAGLVVAGSAMVQGFGHGSAIGLLFALLVLICESLFSLLAVPLLPKFGELRVSALVTSIAVPVLLIAGLATDGTAMLRVPSPAEAAALLYLALPLTVGAFLLWYRALSGLGPQRAGLLIGCVPVSACAASAALGVGTPGIAQLVGVAVVVAGIVCGLARA